MADPIAKKTFTVVSDEDLEKSLQDLKDDPDGGSFWLSDGPRKIVERHIQKYGKEGLYERVEPERNVWRLIDRMLENSIADLPGRMVELFCKNSVFANNLVKSFSAAGYDLKPKNVTPDASVSSFLPNKAPRLWAERPSEERHLDPAAFIRKVYAPWLNGGLTRAHIRQYDPTLYVAYAQWIRPERHPQDAIIFAHSHLFNAYADPVEATEQRRRLAREARARQRAKAKMDKLSQNSLSHDNE